MEVGKKKVEKEIAKHQAVQLQKNSLTPFQEECKTQLASILEPVRRGKISDISKFHYLLELVEREPKEYIVRLPQTPQF